MSKEGKNNAGCHSRRDRGFVLLSSLAASAFVWWAVVRGVGYSLGLGFLYFLGFFLLSVLYFHLFGYRLFGRPGPGR